MSSSTLFEAGLAVRREVLGDTYVDQSLAGADDFNMPFQQWITENCWGSAWGDATLSRRERSLLVLGMLAAQGKSNEFELHVRAALRNGLTRDELRAALMQIAMYCGAPTGVECFKLARKALAAAQAQAGHAGLSPASAP